MEFDKFVLVCAYVPNSQTKLKRLEYRITEWDADFHDYLKALERDKAKPIILAGDLNVAHQDIDIHDPKGKSRYAGFTPEERDSFQKLLERGFTDTFRHLYPEKAQFSYWDQRSRARLDNRGWRIDYFLISDNYEKKHKIKIEDSMIHDQILGSDHCPIELKLQLPVKKSRNQKSQK